MFMGKHALLYRRYRNLFLMALLCAAMALPVQADQGQPYVEEPHQIEASIGYRGVSVDEQSNRALEYDSLISSPTFDLVYRGSCSVSENFVDIHYLNEKDYYLETDFNIRSQIRFRLLNERLYHALDHFPYDFESEPEARPDVEDLRVSYTDQNPGKDYHLQVDQTEVFMRYKLPDYPAHASIKYWRWEKKGSKQLRFVDENCTSCHMQSRTLQMDMVTEEVTAGVDAHLGLIDMIFEQVVRTFRNKTSAPVDFFGEKFGNRREPGEYQHDDAPDSSFTQSTLKAHTTLGGGFVASASAAIGKRENEDSLQDVTSGRAETDFRKLTADTTYIPSQHWTLNLRYRMLDLDQDNPAIIEADGELQSPFAVRDSLDLERSYYEASLNYRPSPHLNLKGSYHREDIHRSNTGGPVDSTADPYWELPGDETTQKARLTVSARLLQKNALRLQGWYEYQTSDDPAYSISIEDGQTLYFSASYRHNPRWGGTASARFRELENSGYRSSQYDEFDTLWYADQDRKQRQHNASLGLWFIPRDGVSFDVNLGYLGTHIKQDVLFGDTAPSYAIEDQADYHQSVHTLSAGVNWQLSEQVDCRLEGYQIRSKAEFSPEFPTETLPGGIVSASADDLEDISRVNLRQNGVKGRLNWQINDEWSTSVELTLDDYDDKESNQFDGTVETCMFNLARSW